MATVLVTGGNRGIGLQLCKQLIARGDAVFAAVRHSSGELTASGATVLEGFDVTKPETYDVLDRGLPSQLDLLINNAGILRRSSLEHPAYPDILAQFQVNAVGPLQLSQHLLPRLGQGSKIALITSRMGSMADNSSGGSYGYRMSKAALNAAGKSLAVDLKERGIAVGLLHPGYVQTDMTGNTGNITPEESARLLLARIAELNVESSGRFVHANGEELPF